MQRFFGRLLGTVALLAVAFTGGVSSRDLAAAHSPAALRDALARIPDRVGVALVTAAHGQTEAESPYQTYADVLTTLQANYYGKEIDPTQMTYNGIRGMMGSLHDRFTSFLDPKAYNEMMTENRGEFAGIGAELSQNPHGQVYVYKVLRASPALRAHVLNGDVILKVNGKSVLKTPYDEVVSLIRGEPKTRVTLTLLRAGHPQPVVIGILRDIVHPEYVHYSMLDSAAKIGYIQLSQFTDTSDAQIGHALTDLQRQGMRGLIFDLRENPGGLLESAQEIASRFVPSGPIVWIKDRTETQETMQHLDVDPSQKQNHLRFPMVVLVNGDSASAAEIVSGAIKDTHSGLLVGEKTYGKGLVQTIYSLPDNSAAKITTQHYYTAHKNDINHKGILPDLVVKQTDADQRRMYAFFRQPTHINDFYDLKDDRQLQTAVSALGQQMRVASARPW